jgi:hypothetical protein
MSCNSSVCTFLELPPGLPDPSAFARNSYATAIPQILLYTGALISITFLIRFIKSLQG